MKSLCLLVVMAPLGVALIGCGGQPAGSSPQAAADSQPAVNSPAPIATTAQHSANASPASVATSVAPSETPKPVNIPHDLPPQEVVGRFLDALRGGDEAVAAELLTSKARTETAKHDLAVQPPGTPQATYRVGQVEIVTDKKDGAHVTSIWSEPTPDGGSESYQIVWVMRHETHGWRIAGMATEVVPGQAPLFLNFEDPADMLAKWQAADAELAKSQEGPAAQQARQPATSPTTQQR